MIRFNFGQSLNKNGEVGQKFGKLTKQGNLDKNLEN